jgi:hypothetical protein
MNCRVNFDSENMEKVQENLKLKVKVIMKQNKKIWVVTITRKYALISVSATSVLSVRWRSTCYNNILCKPFYITVRYIRT